MRGGLRVLWPLLIVIAGCVWPSLVPAQSHPVIGAAGAAAATAKRTHAPVTSIAVVKLDEEKTTEMKITLVSRTEDKLIFVPGELPVGIRKELPIRHIEQLFFQIKIELGKLELALRKQDWETCIQLLGPAVRPLLPYLDVPNNNGAELSLQLGDAMIRLADVKSRTAVTEAEKTAVDNLYKQAYAVLRYVARAEWAKESALASLKGCRCLLALRKPKTARAQWEKIPQPVPGDAAYGLYWLVKGELEAEKGDFRLAMDGAVKSLCFANKDIDTFPDALALSARCYEELQMWHRARDVYYELARLFPKTDWSRNATNRLQYIMAQGLTKKEEEVPIEYVFFKYAEDMNKLVTDFLEGRVGEGKGRKADAFKTPKKTTEQQIQEELDGERENDASPPATRGSPLEPAPPARTPVRTVR